MLEKACLNPHLSRAWILTTVKCAENIARWWLMEERRTTNGAAQDIRVSFPGEVAMPHGLMPAALWLRTRVYSPREDYYPRISLS